MSVFNIFKTAKPARQEPTPIKLAKPDGTYYFLRLRNWKTGFDDTLRFATANDRASYQREANALGSPWYCQTWETTAEERLQPELKRQREIYEREIRLIQAQPHRLNSNQQPKPTQPKPPAQLARLAYDRKRLAQKAMNALHSQDIMSIYNSIVAEYPEITDQHGNIQAICIEFYLQKIIDL
jgi:hypothetical protein